MKFNVYLLKSADETAKDKYVEYLSSSSNKSHMINEIKLVNLLEFKFVNLKLFEKKLNDFFNKRVYSCLIITSRQIVEAMRLVDLKADKGDEEKFLVYCVGEQTAFNFRDFLLNKHPLLVNSVDIRIPIVKQSANELANLILKENSDSGSFYALYPCSSIRKEDLIVKLTESKLKIDELTLYETTTSENGIKSLLLIDFSNKQNCFVFFSPSCVQSVFENEHLKEKLLETTSYYFIVSIGPSTSLKIKSILHNENFIEMNEPSPKGLVDSLQIIYNKQFK